MPTPHDTGTKGGQGLLILRDYLPLFFRLNFSIFLFESVLQNDLISSASKFGISGLLTSYAEKYIAVSYRRMIRFLGCLGDCQAGENDAPVDGWSIKNAW